MLEDAGQEVAKAVGAGRGKKPQLEPGQHIAYAKPLIRVYEGQLKLREAIERYVRGGDCPVRVKRPGLLARLKGMPSDV